jgi:hypothetical protein
MRLGHTSQTLGAIERTVRTLDRLLSKERIFSTPVIMETIQKMRELPNRRPASGDLEFLTAITGLLERRDNLMRNKWRNYAMYGVAAGICAWLARSIAGPQGDIFLRAVLFLMAASTFVFFLSSAGQSDYFEMPDAIDSFITLSFFAVFFVSFFQFEKIRWTHPHILTFSTGMVSAFTVCFGLESIGLSRNEAKILDACAAYSEEL